MLAFEIMYKLQKYNQMLGYTTDHFCRLPQKLLFKESSNRLGIIRN